MRIRHQIFIAFLAVKEFWRYVKFWPSYSYEL